MESNHKTDKAWCFGPVDELGENQEYKTTSKANAAMFLRIGVVVLSIMMLIGFGVRFVPAAITVSNFRGGKDFPISNVKTEERKVALSFEVDQGSEDIGKILDILSKYDVKATFFMTGEWVEEYPLDVKAIAKAGHNLGNHSENHRQMLKLSKEECTEEILVMHENVKKLTGVEMNLFRPPYGDYNNTLVGAARECGYFTVQWDVDSEDWKDYGKESIVKSVVNNKHLENGSIILMHCGTKYTAEALEAVITGLQEKGYELVPVSELIYTGRYAVDGTGRQFAR